MHIGLMLMMLVVSFTSKGEENNQLYGTGDDIFSSGFEELFFVGGETTTANVTVRLNQFDEYVITSSGPYVIPNPIENNRPYQVDLISPPAQTLCSVQNNIGIINSTDVSDVDISCGAIATIYDVKQELVSGWVSIENVLVTECKDNYGYWVQTIPSDIDYIGDNFSGSYVHKNDAICSGPQADVSVGDRISLNPAFANNFFGQTQMLHKSLVIHSSNNTLPNPVIAPVASLGGIIAVPLEGVLVQVQNLTVTAVQTPPGTGEDDPSNSFEVNSALIVDDILYKANPFPEISDIYDNITGIMIFSNGISKLLPRYSQDVFSAEPASTSLVINEVDYDQPQTDTKEFIEIFNPTNTTISLQNTSLYLINGGSNTDYHHYDLDSHGSILSGQYLVIASASVLDTVAYGALTQELDGSIQNGAADGMVLIDRSTNAVIDGLSYEGNIFNAMITDLGITVDITEGTSLGLVDSGAGGLARIPNGADTDNNDTDWSFTPQTTPGSANVTELIANNIVINEIDYDQVGPDVEEFVEIYNPSDVSVSLANVSLYFINGGNNSDYYHYDLDSHGSLLAGQYLVLGSSNMIANVAPGSLTQTFDSPSSHIQNGPDGIVLINRTDNSVIDGVAYEGNIVAATITDLGITVDITEGTSLGLVDSGAGGLARIPNGTDTDNNDTDWLHSTNLTPGDDNLN